MWKRQEDSPQYAVWYLVLSMEMTTVYLVRLFREANFVLYCQVVSSSYAAFLCQQLYTFASYSLERRVNIRAAIPCSASWIHVRKICCLQVQTTIFWLRLFNQAHEHSNVEIKSDCEAIGITDLYWVVAVWGMSPCCRVRITCRFKWKSQAPDKDHSKIFLWKGTQVILYF